VGRRAGKVLSSQTVSIGAKVSQHTRSASTPRVADRLGPTRNPLAERRIPPLHPIRHARRKEPLFLAASTHSSPIETKHRLSRKRPRPRFRHLRRYEPGQRRWISFRHTQGETSRTCASVDRTAKRPNHQTRQEIVRHHEIRPSSRKRAPLALRRLEEFGIQLRWAAQAAREYSGQPSTSRTNVPLPIA
jgi:hypothetical protein